MSAILDDSALRAALEPHVSKPWPVEKLILLCHFWRSGISTSAAAAKVGVTKNALVGKAHRLIDSGDLNGYLEGRPSPLPQGGQSRTIRPQPLPPGARTLPPLASERAELRP